MTKLDSVYNPENYEKKIWKFWMDGGYFHAQPDPNRRPYTILMPPPNVTSQLHMGHGLGYSIQDLFVRWKRMSGYNACWLPGTDHAGIATQMMVEKSLEEEGTSRRELGREAFVDRCHQWKEKYGGQILEQFAGLGFSCDWNRVAYTMDPHLSKAVRHVFVTLYQEGLIYRGERLVNWDCVLQTAVSDDEVETREVNGHLWTLLYPLEGSDEKIPIATTRPETMLGDTAVAVHPEDERYKQFIGKKVRLPFSDRLIPVIGDDYVKSEFGTGAVKITPAHDPNDFDIGKRHKLPFIAIMNDDGTMNDLVPERFRGMDRFVARKEVLRGLKDEGLFVEEKSYKHSIPHSERSKSVIEPKLSLQWYVKMRDMAEDAAKEAREERLHFYPDSWKKTYLYWLDNIQDWCISRQLWWGHRLPIWYCDDCEGISTGMEDPTSCSHCGSAGIRQDEDVLDTWFSSWLWPISPFGWPDESPDLDYFYPTDTMITGAEIIFLWVARMVMVGRKFLGHVPFRDIYFNAIVCDKNGRKFSKTLGNGIDPLEVIDKHGADAVRFTAISLAPLGGRVRMDIKDFDNGSRFINKIWNASRLLLSHHQEGDQLESLQNLQLSHSEKWLVHRLGETAGNVTRLLETYRVNEAVDQIYHYFWGSLCDWGLEAAKDSLAGDDAGRQRALSALVYCLGGALRLAHPVIPFVTEELFGRLPPHPDWEAAEALCVARFPRSGDIPEFAEAAAEWATVQSLISGIRSVRAQAGLSHKERPAAHIRSPADTCQLFAANHQLIGKLAGLASLEASPDLQRPGKSLTHVGRGYEAYLPVADLLDIGKETKRLKQEEQRLSKIVAGLEKKLANDNFVSRAPADVLAETKEKLTNMETQITSIRQNLNALAD